MIHLQYSLAAKLASLIVHTEELTSSDGHNFDRIAIQSLLTDKEMIEFAGTCRTLGLAPVKRSEPPRQVSKVKTKSKKGK